MATALAVAPLLYAQHVQTPPTDTNERLAGQVYKNVKVLKQTPADQFIQGMHVIKAALGVDCEYCHEEDRSADIIRAKNIARDMMRMMIALNEADFNGRQQVTCYTCHRGSPDPQNASVLPVAEQEDQSDLSLPSVDEILAKYINALGGEKAIRRITSRVIFGTQFIPSGPGGTIPVPAVIERYQKAPNLMVNVYHTATYTIAYGFDGDVAWSEDMKGRIINGDRIDQARARRTADLYEPLDLKSEYSKMGVRGIEEVNGHTAYVVEGDPMDDLPEQLYFDAQTGLLVRKRTSLPTPVGNSPFEVDYEDYRNSGSGVKVPYLIIMYPADPRAELGTSATIRVTKVEENIAIDPAKFAKPEIKLTAAQ